LDKELAALLNRAAAALETPADLTAADRTALIEDLVVAAESGQERYPRTRSATFLWISTRDALEALRRAKSPAWQTLSTRYARAAADVAQELAGALGAEIHATYFGSGTATHALRMPNGETSLPAAYLPRSFTDNPQAETPSPGLPGCG